MVHREVTQQLDAIESKHESFQDAAPCLGTSPDVIGAVDREILLVVGAPPHTAACIQMLLLETIAAGIHDEVHVGKLALILHSANWQD